MFLVYVYTFLQHFSFLVTLVSLNRERPESWLKPCSQTPGLEHKIRKGVCKMSEGESPRHKYSLITF